MNYNGFLAEKEFAEQDGSEYLFGAESQPAVINVPIAELEEYLPMGEVQRVQEDTEDCATRSAIHKMDVDFSYGYRGFRFKQENIKWLKDNGYVFDEKGNIRFSFAFIAILSGTTRQGNSLKAPIQAIHEKGLIPYYRLPTDKTMTWDEYMNPARITPEMLELGQEFLKRFSINYEQVFAIHTNELLKEDLLCTAGHAWTNPVDGEYPATDLPFNHAFLKLHLPATFIFDSYIDPVDGDFIKKLAADYKFWPYDYRVFISKETTSEQREIQVEVAQTLSLTGLINFFMDWWERLTAPKPQPVLVKPLVPPTPEPAPVVNDPPPKYYWLTPTAACHSARVICDEEGLSVAQKNLVCEVINCESGFKFNARNDNVKDGKVLSTDWGICQINDYWHIGPDKQFPSAEWVVNNPEACVRWMIKMFKAGRLNLWVCYSSGLYKKYDGKIIS